VSLHLNVEADLQVDPDAIGEDVAEGNRGHPLEARHSEAISRPMHGRTACTSAFVGLPFQVGRGDTEGGAFDVHRR
jgi:hypothetical protein